MLMPKEFPPHRRQDPKRAAEAEVYDEIASSPQAGKAIYEVKTSRPAPELDFAVIIEGVAIFGVQVKGGRYVIDGTHWRLITDDGPEDVSCPMAVTWDAAMQVREAVFNRLSRKMFVVPVLLFPDMSVSKTISARAENDRVRVMFGADRLVERLSALVADEEIFCPPSSWMVDAIAETLMPSLSEDEPDDGPVDPLAEVFCGPSPDSPDLSDPPSAPPMVQHADVVNVYQGPVTIYQGKVADAPDEEQASG